MAEKRFQVFISSTYTDLQEERRKVIQTIMEMDCIPAGMELFPAADEEQFTFITKIIDDCDYYIIIIGGRYGNLTDDGISYTEKEYDYAVSKDIKVLAFLHGAPGSIPVDKSEGSLETQAKLSAFREKVRGGRLVRFWTSAAELPGLVALALLHAIKTYPALGWVRGDIATAPELLKQLNDLRTENRELQAEISVLQTRKPLAIPNIASGEDEIILHGTFSVPGGEDKPWEHFYSWNTIFAIFGPTVMSPVTTSRAARLFESAIKAPMVAHFMIHPYDFDTILFQLKALGLIDTFQTTTSDGDVRLFCRLTEDGLAYLTDLRVIRKPGISKSVVTDAPQTSDCEPEQLEGLRTTAS
jgi:Domain of unknown function (DUF4062)